MLFARRTVMFRYGLLVILGLLVTMNIGYADTASGFVWHDAKTLTFEGRGWNDTDGFYKRFPAHAKATVDADKWASSDKTPGMVVRFISDSTAIRAKWSLSSPDLALKNMDAIGVSGLDLYARYNGKWRWLGVGKPTGVDNEATLIEDLPAGKREYALYLPLYNGLTSLEIGIKEGAKIEPAGPRPRNLKPVVFYGTSVTQGGCASRPGMEYPAIIGRRLDVPIINLGFSGGGKCEPEVADLLAELDPQVFVIDCLGNMKVEDVDGRLRYLLKMLKQHRPNTPVILVAVTANQSWYAFPPATSSPMHAKAANLNAAMLKVYKDNVSQWNGKLLCIPNQRMLGDDSEASVDGSHPSDLGHMRMADAITPTMEKALRIRQ